MPRVLIDQNGREYESSIARQPVAGPVELTAEGFAGDGCSYKGHAGPNMKVNAFPEESYRILEARAGQTLPVPGFGENLSLGVGYGDGEARIGDMARLGTAVLQVSQPREPCGNVTRFLGLTKVLRWMAEESVSGFYFRVLESGTVAPGDRLEVIERGADERWTIMALNRMMAGREGDEATIAELLDCAALSENWKKSFKKQRSR